jgi:hypothetical protein
VPVTEYFVGNNSRLEPILHINIWCKELNQKFTNSWRHIVLVTFFFTVAAYFLRIRSTEFASCDPSVTYEFGVAARILESIYTLTLNNNNVPCISFKLLKRGTEEVLKQPACLYTPRNFALYPLRLFIKLACNAILALFCMA